MQKQFVEITDFGAAHLLKFNTSEIKEDLKANEVSIDVKFSGINFADIVMRLGQYQDAPPKPFTPGYEVSGIITKIGSNVTHFQVGDEVMAGTRFGGYTSKLILPEWSVLKKPNHLSLEEAAAVPVNYITAHIALNEFARVRAGDKILLDCATGGVGVFCMQIAKDAGAEVIGLTTSEHKKEFIESYGARAYTFEEFEKSGETGFNFILNSSGGKSLKTQYELLTKSGLICCIGMQASINNGKSNIFKFTKTLISMPWYPIVKLIMQSRSVSGFNALKYFEDEPWLKANLPIIEKCPYKPFVGKTFDAKEVSSAHEFLEQRKAKGKVLLHWS